jgi:hypothetical protein
MPTIVTCWLCSLPFVPRMGLGPSDCPDCGQPNERPIEYRLNYSQPDMRVLEGIHGYDFNTIDMFGWVPLNRRVQVTVTLLDD